MKIFTTFLSSLAIVTSAMFHSQNCFADNSLDSKMSEMLQTFERLQRSWSASMEQEADATTKFSKHGIVYVDEEANVVIGTNKRYSFWLERHQQDSPWMISNIELAGVDKIQTGSKAGYGVNSLRIMKRFRGLAVNGVDLRSLLTSKYVISRKMEHDHAVGDGLYKVSMKIDKKGLTNDKEELAKICGSRSMKWEYVVFWADPARNWLPIRIKSQYEFRPESGYCETVVTSTDSRGDIHFPVELKSTLVNVSAKHGRRVSTSQRTFTYSYDDDFPAEDFTLTAFGLPEPNLPEKSSVSYVVLIGLAIAIAIAGVLFRMLGRSRAFQK